MLRYISHWLTNDALDKEEMPMDKSYWDPILFAASMGETGWAILASALASVLLAPKNQYNKDYM